MTQNEDIRPFMLYDRVYFVGSRAVSVHLVDTGSGFVMIDSGYPWMRETVLSNMKELGFDPSSVKIILHSHGHIDHIGTSLYFRNNYGTQLAISETDNEIVNGNLNLSWADELGLDRPEPFSCEILLKDGDTVRMGDVGFTCKSAPGHTAGTVAIFFEVSGKRFAMHGGVGINSMEKDFLRKYSLPFDCRDRFREGLHKLADERVDIVLGNHPDQNGTEEKYAKLKAGDSDAFVDPTEWRRFLSVCEARLDDLIRKEENTENRDVL